MRGHVSRFDNYQLVVLKKLWLIATEDWEKYITLRRELGAFLREQKYSDGSMRKLLTQKPGGSYKLDVYLASHLKFFLNKKIVLYNQKHREAPMELIGELLELYQHQQREVLVA